MFLSKRLISIPGPGYNQTLGRGITFDGTNFWFTVLHCSANECPEGSHYIGDGRIYKLPLSLAGPDGLFGRTQKPAGSM